MKSLLTLLVVLLVFSSCQKEVSNNDGSTNIAPQVEIPASTIINSMLPNTKINGYWLDSGYIAIPDTGNNISLNYSSVPDNQLWADSLKSPANTTDYATATYMTGLNISLIGQTIASNQYFKLSNANWSDLGGYFSAPVNFSYSGYSLNVPSQTSKNNPARVIVNFPIKYADTIKQTSAASFTVNISGSYNGIQINGPLTVTTSTAVKSKNLSSGYIKLKGYPDSLQTIIQRYHTSTSTTLSSSNFIINSLLTILLGQLNLPSNQTIESTQYYYWAKNKGLVMRRENNGVAFIRTGL